MNKDISQCKQKITRKFKKTKRREGIKYYFISAIWRSYLLETLKTGSGIFIKTVSPQTVLKSVLIKVL